MKWRDWDPQQYWNWRAYLDFGGGQVTDLFTHWIDVVHMFMGRTIPTSARGRRRRLPLQGRPHRARHHQRAARIPGRAARRRSRPRWRPASRGAGVEICGTEGKLWIDREQFEFTPAGNAAPSPSIVKVRATIRPSITSRTSSIACRTRKLPNGDVYIGHRSAQASHLGNIAYVQKRRIKFDPVREEILPL